MFAVTPAVFAHVLGLQSEKIGDATAFIAKALPTPIFNRVIGLGSYSPVSINKLMQITLLYNNAGNKHWWIHVSPTSFNTELDNQLLNNGFNLTERRAWVKLLRNDTKCLPITSHAQIVNIQDDEAESLADCTQLFTETGEPLGEEPNPSYRNFEACGFQKAFSRLLTTHRQVEIG